MDALLDTNTKTHEAEAISQSEERKLSGLSFIKRTKRLFAEQLSGPSTLVAACAPSGRKAKPRNFLSPSAIGAAAAAARLSIANVSLNRDQHGSQPIMVLQHATTFNH
uniref:Uncharacterized protein n=1 Tax=Anopheles coluzzii TaxID=1518534 RepID=A0A8W7PKM6_ANOCL